MATIVWHRDREAKYVLLGAGFGAYKAMRGHAFFQDMLPVTDEGTLTYALVCDNEGNVSWVDTMQIHVISIDGVDPSEALAD